MVLPRPSALGHQGTHVVVPDTAQIAVQAAQPSAGRFRQLVVPIHHENHPVYGPVDIDQADIAEYAANFRAGVKTYHGAAPVEIDHDESRGAGGWVYRVFEEPDGLWAEGEYTPTGVGAIVEQTFPFISPNLWPTWTDPVTGLTHRNVFDGFSLVMRPEFRSLPPATVQHYREDPHPTVIVVGHNPTPGPSPQAERGEESDIMADETVEATIPAEAVEEGAVGAGLVPAPEEAAPGQGQAQPVQAEGDPADGDETEEQVVEVLVPREKLEFGEAGPQQFAEREAALAERETALAQERQEFAEQRRAQTRLQFSERVAGLKFGEHRLAPAGREALADLAADIHDVDPALAQRFGEALSGLHAYLEGEVGLDRLKPKPAAADPEMQKFAETHGIDDETMQQAQESTTWRR